MHVRNHIPEGWNEYKMSGLTKIDAKSLSNRTSGDYKFKYISLADVNKGMINDELTEYRFSDAPSRARRSVKKNDVLMATVRPNLEGFACIKKEVENVIASTGFAVLTPLIESDSDYLHQYLYSYEIRRQIYALVVGSNYPAINSTDVKKLKILAPTLPKTRALIGKFFFTWNSAIEKTERLIKMKEKVKKGLAQNLLFGKLRVTRDKTFNVQKKKWFSIPSEWKVVKIGSVSKEVTVRNQNGDDVPVLSCTKYDGLVDSLKYFDKQIFSKDTSVYKVVANGQFAYATNHIEEGSIGYQDLYPQGLVSPMYTVFKTDKQKISDGYLYKLLKTETYRRIFEINTNASVNRRGSLRWKEFSRLPIPFPSLDEQTKINEVLDTAQKEIDLHKGQLELLKKQKRGLMQKLLTGQWRIKNG